MRKYRGKYSLVSIEQAAGDFDRVLMKAVDTVAIALEPGQRMLTTIGYSWPCGCEARGHGQPDWALVLLWSACGDHGRFLEEPFVDAPEDTVPIYDISRVEATGATITVNEAKLRADNPDTTW